MLWTQSHLNRLRNKFAIHIYKRRQPGVFWFIEIKVKICYYTKRMKRKILILATALVVLGAGGYFSRHWLLDTYRIMILPELPKPVDFTQAPSNPERVTLPPPSPIEGGVATSEHFTLESNPQGAQKQIDPLQIAYEKPEEINLSVPWMSQAPYADWSMPYQEACEEACMIMVDRFYKKQTGRITLDDADKSIRDLVDYENKVLGFYKDTTAEETAKVIRDYFGYIDVRVIPFQSSEDIKNIVGRGYPVIIPFSGKNLNNTNFRNGGPLYHMLVIKGYTKQGMFITCDPGTRKGEDYLYTFQNIVDSAHDWNGGDVEKGGKFMIVVLPNKITQ